MLGGVCAAAAATVSAGSHELPVESSKTVILVERVVTFGPGRRSRVMFFRFFLGQPRANHSLLRRFSDHGHPKVVSKAGDSREAV